MRKRSIISAGISFFIISISSCGTGIDQQEMDNKTVVAETLDILNNREYEKLDQVYAQDFKRYCQATPEAVVEKLDDFKALLVEWDKQFPDNYSELHMTAAEGDLVAFYMTYSATQEGPIGEFPATGKKMSAECAGFHRLKDGKITETWVTWDNLAILTQLGLFPPPTTDE